MTVRDLRDIRRYPVDLKKSMKNSAGGAFGAYSAGEGAFESLVSVQPEVEVHFEGVASRKCSVLGFRSTRCGV
jgi:hypothetical protein